MNACRTEEFRRYDFPTANHAVDRGAAHLGDFGHLVDSKKLNGHVSALLLGCCSGGDLHPKRNGVFDIFTVVADIAA